MLQMQLPFLQRRFDKKEKTKKLSKLESQPRTHKGATREANTTATQKFRPAKHRLEHDVRNINDLSWAFKRAP